MPGGRHRRQGRAFILPVSLARLINADDAATLIDGRREVKAFRAGVSRHSDYVTPFRQREYVTPDDRLLGPVGAEEPG